MTTWSVEAADGRSAGITLDVDLDCSCGSFPLDATRIPDVLSATLRLLDDDPHAAYMVAALVSCTQGPNETRPAFVKRIVRAWIDEMGRPVQG